MNEKHFFKPAPDAHPAMEGRLIDKDGVDRGDWHFHEVGMATTAEAEEKDLEAIRAYIESLDAGRNGPET